MKRKKGLNRACMMLLVAMLSCSALQMRVFADAGEVSNESMSRLLEEPIKKARSPLFSNWRRMAGTILTALAAGTGLYYTGRHYQWWGTTSKPNAHQPITPLTQLGKAQKLVKFAKRYESRSNKEDEAIKAQLKEQADIVTDVEKQGAKVPDNKLNELIKALQPVVLPVAKRDYQKVKVDFSTALSKAQEKDTEWSTANKAGFVTVPLVPHDPKGEDALEWIGAIEALEQGTKSFEVEEIREKIKATIITELEKIEKADSSTKKDELASGKIQGGTVAEILATLDTTLEAVCEKAEDAITRHKGQGDEKLGGTSGLTYTQALEKLKKNVNADGTDGACKTAFERLQLARDIVTGLAAIKGKEEPTKEKEEPVETAKEDPKTSTIPAQATDQNKEKNKIGQDAEREKEVVKEKEVTEKGDDEEEAVKKRAPKVDPLGQTATTLSDNVGTGVGAGDYTNELANSSTNKGNGEPQVKAEEVQGIITETPATTSTTTTTTTNQLSNTSSGAVHGEETGTSDVPTKGDIGDASKRILGSSNVDASQPAVVTVDRTHEPADPLTEVQNTTNGTPATIPLSSTESFNPSDVGTDESDATTQSNTEDAPKQASGSPNVDASQPAKKKLKKK